jgi:propanol-preferring alcohol dehydrogenase
MKAMVLEGIFDLRHELQPLQLTELPDPVPGPDDVVVEVGACGVCHTELDEIEGRTPPPRYPIVPGHQVVGRVTARGDAVERFSVGDRVGVAWIFSSCGRCRLCRNGLENLCQQFKASGRDAHGGYAEKMRVPADFAYPIPERFSDVQAAPLLCAGAIGYRSLALTKIENGQALGLTGFGASAHLVLQMARHRYPNSPVLVFARSKRQRRFARDLGALWAGDIVDTPPQLLDAIIDTTPAWRPVVAAMGALAPGGRLVINAIRKEAADQEALLSLDYPAHLWLEKEIKSVANVTRHDVAAFLELAAEIPIVPETRCYRLTDANQALIELKTGDGRGAKVLTVNGESSNSV